MIVNPQDILEVRKRLPYSNNKSLIRPGLPNEFTHKNILDNYLKEAGSDAPTLGFTFFNEHGLRSDNFGLVDSGHITESVLFAGCSVTYGEGIPYKYTWGYMVSRYIGSKYLPIPYYNIACPGATVTDIVNQIFSYMGEINIPSVIFVNLPDYGREREVLSQSIDKDFDYPPNQTLELQTRSIESLISICNALSIELYIGQWSINKDGQSYDYDIRNSLLNRIYVSLKHDEVDELDDIGFLDNYIGEMPDYYSCMLDIAIDKAHPGILDHKRYAKAFIHAFNKKERTI